MSHFSTQVIIMVDANQIIGRLKETLWLIPAEKFDDFTKDAGYLPSFIYLLVCLVLSLPIVVFASLISPDVSSLSLPTLVLMTVLVRFLMAPLFFYLSAGFSHVFLKLLGGSATFLHTVQVFAYGSTISYIFGPLPLIGLIPSLIGLANVVIGAARVHKMPLWKACVAILVIPLVIGAVISVLVLMYLTPVGGPIVTQAGPT